MARIRCKLTNAQADQVRWALDAMGDHWCSEAGAEGRDGPEYPETDLPTLTLIPSQRPCKDASRQWTLELSPVGEINDDLIYRIEDQLDDMVRQLDDKDNPAPKADARAGRNAAARIRHAENVTKSSAECCTENPVTSP